MMFRPCYRCVKCQAEFLDKDLPRDGHFASTLHASRGLMCYGKIEPVFIISPEFMRIGFCSQEDWDNDDWVIESVNVTNGEKPEGRFQLVYVCPVPTTEQYVELVKIEDEERHS